MFRLLLLLLLGLANTCPAQNSKWTPPPAVALEKMIGADNTLTAKTIRQSWGSKSVAAGKQRWVEKNTLLVGILSETPVTIETMDGEKNRYWWGTVFHGSRHAAVILPEILTWLWEE